MTTVVLKLPPALATRLATAADILKLTHEETVEEALRLFLRSIVPPTRQSKRRCRT